MNKAEETIKKHKHEVPEKCDHEGELEHCDKCDEVYCKKCGKEWKQYGTLCTYTNALNSGTTATYWHLPDDFKASLTCHYL